MKFYKYKNEIVYFFGFFEPSSAHFFAWRHVARVVFEKKYADQLAQTHIFLSPSG